MVLKYNHNHYDTADADPNELEEVSSNNDMGMLAFGIEVVDAWLFTSYFQMD